MRLVVEQLLRSDISNHQLARETGVSRSSISRVRSGIIQLDNMSFRNVEKLYQYALKQTESRFLNE